jgi:hypothetical protein
MHDIRPIFKEKTKKVKRMPGELAHDEPIENAEHAFKVTVFIPVLDTVIAQLQGRFSLHETKLLTEMHAFTPSSLLRTTETDLAEDDISELYVPTILSTPLLCYES